MLQDTLPGDFCSSDSQAGPAHFLEYAHPLTHTYVQQNMLRPAMKLRAPADSPLEVKATQERRNSKDQQEKQHQTTSGTTTTTHVVDSPSAVIQTPTDVSASRSDSLPVNVLAQQWMNLYFSSKSGNAIGYGPSSRYLQRLECP